MRLSFTRSGSRGRDPIGPSQRTSRRIVSLESRTVGLVVRPARRSWLCCPALTALPHDNRRPNLRDSTGQPVASSRSATSRQFIRAAWTREVADGASAAAGPALPVPGTADQPPLGRASVSAAALLVAAWGVVRLAARRSRACRQSRDRRRSGSDSEATGRPAGLPRRQHPGRGRRSVDSDSATTRLPTFKSHFIPHC